MSPDDKLAALEARVDFLERALAKTPSMREFKFAAATKARAARWRQIRASDASTRAAAVRAMGALERSNFCRTLSGAEALAFVDGFSRGDLDLALGAMHPAVSDAIVIELSPYVERVTLTPIAPKGQRAISARTTAVAISEECALALARTEDPAVRGRVTHEFGSYYWNGIMLEHNDPHVLRRVTLDILVAIDAELADLIARGRVLVEPLDRALGNALTYAEAESARKRPTLPAPSPVATTAKPTRRAARSG